METERQPEHYEQLVLFDVEKVLGKLALNRWDDMGCYFEGDLNHIVVFEHGHVETYDRYGPLGDSRSIAREGEW